MSIDSLKYIYIKKKKKKKNNNVNFRQIFKIILINDDSFLQMYHHIEVNFLSYWFLKIKWLFAKSVKITKEIAIYRNAFSPSF